MKVRSFTTRLIQLNTYLLYLPQDLPGQLVASLPDDDIKVVLYHAMSNMWEKENGRTGIQLLRWSHPFYGKIFWDQEWKFRKIKPTKCSLKKQKEGQEIPPRKGKLYFLTIQRMKIQTKVKKVQSYACFIAHAEILQISAQLWKFWLGMPSRNKASSIKMRKSTSNVK